MNMPMTSPELMLKLFKAREQELLKEAATARLVKDARARRHHQRNRFIAGARAFLTSVARGVDGVLGPIR